MDAEESNLKKIQHENQSAEPRTLHMVHQLFNLYSLAPKIL